MFKPSRQLCESVADSQKETCARKMFLGGAGLPAQAELPTRGATTGEPSSFSFRRLDAHSRNAPVPGSEINIAEVQTAIGEELDRTLGSLALRLGTVQPDVKQRIMTGDGRFERQLGANLAERLGMVGNDQKSAMAFEQFSREFYEWIVKDPNESKDRGLEVTPAGDVLLICPAARTALSPLDR